MGLSYTWCNFTKVTPGVTSHTFCEPLIIIRSKGQKTLIVASLLFPKN